MSNSLKNNIPSTNTAQKVTSLNLCPDIDMICAPLKELGIIYFHYIQSFKDGSRITLSNNQDWMSYYYQNHFYTSPAIDKNPENNMSSNHLWLSLNDTHIFQELRERFDIGNGITLIRKSDVFCNFFYFGARPDDANILNFYLNNLNVLERFLFYFMENAKPVIQYANKHRIIIPFPEGIAKQSDINPILLCDPTSISNFIHKTPIKKYKFLDNNKELQFSPKQMECILGLLEGKSSKDIARAMKLSNRTVESYIVHLKNKLNLRCKSDLINKLHTIIL